MKTSQEVFDIVATHLLTQNAQSRLENGTCAYRGANGLKCAVGVLIADEQYDPAFEGKAYSAYMVQEALEANNVNSNYDVFLLGTLQRLHDYSAPDEWFRKLQKVAASYNLSTNALDRFAPIEGQASPAT